MTDTHVPMLTLGRRLRMAREDAGLSSAEMAVQLDVSRQLISRWERDGGEPKASYVRGWAELTNVSADWLLENTLCIALLIHKGQLSFDDLELPPPPQLAAVG